MQSQEYLGLDVGEKRVGIARASQVARLAQPLKIVETKNAVSELKQLTADSGVLAIVVGLPRGLDGQETAQTKWVQDWVETAKSEIKTPFIWQDEALTSQVAAQRQPQLRRVDAEAAAIILQDYLDAQTN